MTSLKMYLNNTNTDMTTTKVLLSYVHHFLEDIKPPPLSEIAPNASPELIRAVLEQEELGWDQWFCGRSTISWGELYNHDIKTNPNTKKTADKWGTDIISLAWEFTLSAWFARNNVEHDNDNNPVLRSKMKLIEQIMWTKTKTEQHRTHQYTDLQGTELLELPLDNLHMILENLESMKIRKKIPQHKET
jgi:hypothetical protein